MGMKGVACSKSYSIEIKTFGTGFQQKSLLSFGKKQRETTANIT